MHFENWPKPIATTTDCRTPRRVQRTQVQCRAPKHLNKDGDRKLWMVLVAKELQLWRLAAVQSMAKQTQRGDSAPDQTHLGMTSGGQLRAFETSWARQFTDYI